MSDAVYWEVIHPETGNTVSAYDTEREARDAARWYGETYGRNLAVVGFNAEGEATDGPH